MVEKNKSNKDSKESGDSSLADLKKNYSVLHKKYSLPEFNKLNEDFQIEHISDSETDFLLREIRKLIGDKFSNYMRFIEMLLNPVSVPMFVYSVVKSLDESDRETLNKAYKELAKKEIEIVSLDTIYSEDGEASFIKGAYESWQNIKKDINVIIKKVDLDKDNGKKMNNDKNYFG